jgi:hypothetical protein
LASSEYSFSIYFEKEDFTISVSHTGKRLTRSPVYFFSGFETVSCSRKTILIRVIALFYLICLFRL